MPDDTNTQLFTAPAEQPSSIFGVSLRGWIAILLASTVCANQLLVTGVTVVHGLKTGNLDLVGTLSTIGEPLYSLSVAALGFYFGQKTTSKP